MARPSYEEKILSLPKGTEGFAYTISNLAEDSKNLNARQAAGIMRKHPDKFRRKENGKWEKVK